MAIKLNKAAYDHAVYIIKNGLEVEHDTNNWDEVQATPDEEIRYLNNHGLEQYGTWFLGIDTDADPKSKDKYTYPFGDFSVLHKSALLEAIKLAAKNSDEAIKTAAEQLLAMIK
ncbi:MAG: hypothetical protein M1114_00200 [Candidatus Dependentiae bacterium]|nr:hypothetical protein [Candidatus Dependentiae bacterium]